MAPSVSAVICSKNEETSIRDIIVHTKKYADEILVIDGHSTDRSASIARSLGCTVLVGGPHVELYPEETMEFPEIDFALRGPAAVGFPVFLRAFRGDFSFSQVPGLAYRRGGTIECNARSDFKGEPGQAPWPARRMIDSPLYFSLISQHQPYTSMMTSPGCPFRCIFCEQGGTVPAGVPAKQVVAEIDALVQKHGVKEIEFFDPVFALDRNRAVEICNGIIQSGIRVYWSARTRPDILDEELLSLMAQAGCIRLYVGIESANDTILAAYNKRFSVQDVVRGVWLIQQAGIKVFGYFLFGAPQETEENIRQSIHLAKELDLDYAQFNKLIAAPHTPLYDACFGSATDDYWVEVKEQSERPPIVSQQFDEQELERLIRRAYLSFYFRPSYILKALRRTRNANEICHAARVAASLLRTSLSSILINKRPKSLPVPSQEI